MGNTKFNWENRARNGCGGGVVSRGTPVSRSSLGMYGAYGTVKIELCHVLMGKALCETDAPIGTVSFNML
jgi:hypothetical protein